MQLHIPIEMLINTALTAAIGWLVKVMLDQLKAYRAESKAWRGELDEKMDALTDATQTTMRVNLIHLYEKYVTRGWITPEERAAWHDQHEKYSALNANGLIDSYNAKLDALPDREID